MGSKALRTQNFTSGDIHEMAIRFFIPFLAVNILTTLHNAADMAIVGSVVGEAGTVAISTSSRLITLITYICTYISTGAQVVIGQFIGKKLHERIPNTIFSVNIILLALSLLISAICYIYAEAFLRLLNTPEAALQPAVEYLRISCFGFPFVFIYTSILNILRGLGNSRLPMLFIAISAPIDILLDYLFVAVFGMGVGGCATGNVVSQIVTLIYTLAVVFRLYPACAEKLRSMRAESRIIADILRIGLPMAISSFCVQFSQLYLISYVNAYDISAVAAYGIGNSVISYITTFSMSFRQAGAPITSQNIGAGKKERVEQFVRFALFLSFSFALILTAVFMMFPKGIFSIFTNSEEVMEYAPPIMLIAALACILASVGDTCNTVTTGSGRTWLTLIAGSVEGLVMRPLFSFYFAFGLDMGILGFFLALALSRFFPLLIHLGYYLSGKWSPRPPSDS